jgi:putative DNA primase/helicase
VAKEGDEMATALRVVPPSERVPGVLNGTNGQGSEDAPPVFAPVFDDGRFIVSAAGELLRAEGHLCMGHDGRIYRYHEGVYVPDGEQWARERLVEILGRTWKRNYPEDVIAWLRAGPVFIQAQPSFEYVNVPNGLLVLRDRTLRPHSPLIASAIQLGARWDPDADCPKIAKFFGEVLPGVPLEFIYELFGYTIYPANPYSKAVMCLGGGSNGKSVFLALLRRLLGQGNYSSVPLQAMSENRFSSADMFGKLANICGDIDARAIKRTDLFKQITGGDPISAERKYGHPFEFRAFATPWFSANDPPMTSDQTDAWFRRWIILPFTEHFDKATANAMLDAQLTTDDEISGLLRHSIEGLHRLVRRGFFEPPERIEEAGVRYRDRLDTVREFVGEECTMSSSAWTLRSGFYKQYVEWCREGGRMPLSAASFNDRLQRDYPEVNLTIVRGQRRWNGISVRSLADA